MGVDRMGEHEAAEAWARLVVAGQTTNDQEPFDVSTREGYQQAVFACYLIARMVRVIPTEKILAAIARADSVGAILDPTAWMRNGDKMLEDRAMVEAVERVRDAAAKMKARV